MNNCFSSQKEVFLDYKELKKGDFMITIFLCDDNPVILEIYKAKLNTIADTYQISIQIQTFLKGEHMLFRMIDANIRPDIIFLDILMKEENGIDIAKKLRSDGCTSEIIFLTANSKYVFESFDVSPTNYILKDDIDDQRFQDIFLRALVRAEQKMDDYFICYGEKNTVYKKIPYRDISHFDIQNRVVTIYFAHDTFSFYAKLDDLENRLSKHNFIRVHRSFLVHLPYIEHMNRNSLILINGTCIPVGVTYLKSVREALHRYMDIYIQ